MDGFKLFRISYGWFIGLGHTHSQDKISILQLRIERYVLFLHDCYPPRIIVIMTQLPHNQTPNMETWIQTQTQQVINNKHYNTEAENTFNPTFLYLLFFLHQQNIFLISSFPITPKSCCCCLIPDKNFWFISSRDCDCFVSKVQKQDS